MTVEESAQLIEDKTVERHDLNQGKRKCLRSFVLVYAIFGSLTGVFAEIETVHMFFNICLMLATLIIAIVWCQIDAQQKNFIISFRLQLLLFLLLIIGLPYYFMKTRNNFQALKAIALTVVFYVILIAISTLTYFIGYITYHMIRS